jgi:glucosamine--fructose-6-phosphate aminotransferase (isomerizing)
MCGIMGYVGSQRAVPILLDGLSRLEYRGYDSAGLAVVHGAKITIVKAVGRLARLTDRMNGCELSGAVGIAHTRWATHGRPSEPNAHPHSDCSGSLALVHNGIIENHRPLRTALERLGHRFTSDTDTEVLAHLIEAVPHQSLDGAVAQALRMVRGSYAVVVVSDRAPDRLVVACHGSPLLIGVGADETFVASDATALLTHTRDHVVLEDGELAVIDAGGFRVTRVSDGTPVVKPATRVSWVPESAERGTYPNFMRKEIDEQPRVLESTLRSLIDPTTGLTALDDHGLDPGVIRATRKMFLVGCGSSYHAALVGKAMIERLAGIPVEVDVASEFRYRAPLIEPGDVVVAISQSGETTDTLAAVRAARAKGANILGVCNVVGSGLARQSDAVLPTAAGPEIGVASTKAFTTQLAVLHLLALFAAEHRACLGSDALRRHLNGLLALPELVSRALQDGPSQAEHIAAHALVSEHALFLGRGINFPIALEGALKLKELSYIHAEAYPAGEMKHGPIALVDRHVPVVVLMPFDEVYDKIRNNLEEIKARDGRIVAVVNEKDQSLADTDYRLSIPDSGEFLTPLLLAIPLQLLAYYAALQRGCDVDKPRNLAKSVTVE